jgi:hypothetical protein
MKKKYLNLVFPIIFLCFLMGAKCPDIGGIWYPDIGGDPLYIQKIGCQSLKITRDPEDFTYLINFNQKPDCKFDNGDMYCGEGKILNNGSFSITISEKEMSKTCTAFIILTFRSDDELEEKIMKDCKNPPFKFDKTYKYFKKILDKKIKK